VSGAAARGVWHARWVNVRSLAIVGVVIVLAACRGNPPASPISNAAPPVHADAAVDAPSSAGETIAKMTGYSDEMCACADQTCVDGVVDAMTSWAQATAIAGRDAVKVTASQTQQLAAITEHMTRCMTEVMVRGASSAGSAVGASAGSGSGSTP
jgi:hypothetical protein